MARSPVRVATEQVPLPVAATLSILRTAALLLDELEPVFVARNTTAARFDVLDALVQFGRPARPVELKERLHLPGQTLTGVFDALERGGLVRRLPNPKDRRSVLVEITDAGRTTVDALCPALEQIEQACLAGLSGRQLELLIDALDVAQHTILVRRSGGSQKT